MTQSSSTRDGFAGKFGVLAATLGSAVGLGNIWKFPYITGENGGASFLLVYILATLLVGLPACVAEIMLGREGRANTVGTMVKLAPKGQAWWGLVGVLGLLSAVLVIGFYSDVMGWVFAYVPKAVLGSLPGTDAEAARRVFAETTGGAWNSLFWQWGVLALVGGILAKGVSKGIERITKILLPLLLVLLCVLAARSLMLPGAGRALEFLFTPDFSKITPSVLLIALGLAFFKLSVGMGIMMTYGSYFRADQNIPLTVSRVVVCDLLISILAGLAIFPAVFSFGFVPEEGAKLLFVTVPAVFAQVPGGRLLVPAFFCLACIAGLGALLSLVEVPTAFVAERLKLSRPKAAALVTLFLALVGALPALSSGPLAHVKVGGRTFFELYDHLSSNVFMPATAILICVFAAWVFGTARMQKSLSNEGALSNGRQARLLGFIVRWVAPLCIGVIMLEGLR